MTKKKPESLTKKQQEAIAKAEKEKAKKSATKTKAEKPAEKKSTAKAATKTKQEKKPVEKSVKPLIKAKTAKAKVAPKQEKEKKAPKKPAFDRDEVFPEVLEIDDSTYTRTDMSYEEICERYENGEDTFFALALDADYLKAYKDLYGVNPPKNEKGKAEFPDNLDFLQVVLVQYATEQILTASIHTEAVLRFQKDNFKADKDHCFKAGNYKFNVYIEDDGEE